MARAEQNSSCRRKVIWTCQVSHEHFGVLELCGSDQQNIVLALIHDEASGLCVANFRVILRGDLFLAT